MSERATIRRGRGALRRGRRALRRGPEAAVTLMELMIALVLGAFVVGLTFQLYTRLHRDYQAQAAVAETQQQVSQVHTMVGRMLRSAGAVDAPISGGLLGGLLFMPLGASPAGPRFSAGPGSVSLPGGPHVGLGFRFVENNWRARSDVFDVSYFASGDASMNGAARHSAVRVSNLGQWDGGTSICTAGAGAPNYDCANVAAPSPAWFTAVYADLAASRRLFFTLSNGYHACLVELRNGPSGGAIHWETGGGSINAGLAAYCGDAGNMGPFNAPAPTPANYCQGTPGGAAPDNSNRACFMFEFGHTGGGLAANDRGPARLRRFYTCGRVGVDTTTAAECLDEAATGTIGTPAIPELHMQWVDGYDVPRDSVVAMGIEDAQISWKLAEFNNRCGVAGAPPNCPCAETGVGAIRLDPTVTSGVYSSLPPANPVGGGPVLDFEDGCDDEARWIRRLTLTLMSVSDVPYATGTFGRSGLRGLNATFNGAADVAGASGGHYLRRILRVDAYLRNIGP